MQFRAISLLHLAFHKALLRNLRHALALRLSWQNKTGTTLLNQRFVAIQYIRFFKDVNMERRLFCNYRENLLFCHIHQPAVCQANFGDDGK